MVAAASAAAAAGASAASEPEPAPAHHVAFKPRCLSSESCGLVLLAFSAILFSLMATFVKLAASTGLPSTELVFLRASFQSLFVLCCMVFCKAKTEAEGGRVADSSRQRSVLLRTPFGGKPEVKRVVLLRGVIGSLGFINFYYTMSALPIGDAISLLSLYPILTIAVAWFFLDEPIQILQVLAAFASVVGAILISRPTFMFQSEDVDNATASTEIDPLGYVTAIFGSCCASAVVVLIRKAGKIGAHTLQLLFSWCTFGILLSLLFGIGSGIKGGDSSWRMPSSRMAWGYVFGVCAFGTIAHFILNYAARLAPAGLSSIARASDIGYGYLWEVLVFKQKPCASTLIGVVLIVLSLVGIAIQKTNDERKKSTTEYELVQTREKDVAKETKELERKHHNQGHTYEENA